MPASQAELGVQPRNPRTDVRVLATAEVLLILGLIFLIIWVVEPSGMPRLDLALRAFIGVLLIASPWLHHDSLDRLGLRLDNFWKALAGVLPISLVAASVAIGAGFFLKSIDPPRNAAVAFAEYFAWAIAQQFALQSVILRRLEDIGLRGAAPVAAAALFSLVHTPNPGLLILTFLGGLLWCSTFRRNPNIVAVALSHAILAVVIVSTLPPEATGGYRIGPPYLAR
jgi:membrane protease YdiL (CAAX protease family)